MSFAPLAFKLFYAARHNTVLRRSPFRPRKNVSLAPRVPMSTFSKPSEPTLSRNCTDANLKIYLQKVAHLQFLGEDCVIFTSDFPKDPPPIWIFKLEISISESLNERGCLVTHYSNENIFMRSNRTGSCIPGAGTVGRMLLCIIRQDGT